MVSEFGKVKYFVHVLSNARVAIDVTPSGITSFSTPSILNAA